MEKIGVINWLLPAFYKRDETILPQIVDPSKLENWKQVTEKVVLAAASVNSDIKTSRVSVSGVGTQAKNYGIGHSCPVRTFELRRGRILESNVNS